MRESSEFHCPILSIKSNTSSTLSGAQFALDRASPSSHSRAGPCRRVEPRNPGLEEASFPCHRNLEFALKAATIGDTSPYFRHHNAGRPILGGFIATLEGIAASIGILRRQWLLFLVAVTACCGGLEVSDA